MHDAPIQYFSPNTVMSVAPLIFATRTNTTTITEYH